MKKQLVKIKKTHKGFHKVFLSNKNLKFGSFGIISKESGFLTLKEIEAVRRIITKFLVKSSYLWIRLKKTHPFSAKPKEVRMGKGKGSYNYSVYKIHVGQVLFEFYSIDEKIRLQLLHLLQYKMSISVDIRPIA